MLLVPSRGHEPVERALDLECCRHGVLHTFARAPNAQRRTSIQTGPGAPLAAEPLRATSLRGLEGDGDLDLGEDRAVASQAVHAVGGAAMEESAAPQAKPIEDETPADPM